MALSFFSYVRPEVFNVIGYWNKVAAYGDAGIRIRINNYLSFKVGYVTGIEIDNIQNITCVVCQSKKWCNND